MALFAFCSKSLAVSRNAYGALHRTFCFQAFARALDDREVAAMARSCRRVALWKKKA